VVVDSPPLVYVEACSELYSGEYLLSHSAVQPSGQSACGAGSGGVARQRSRKRAVARLPADFFGRPQVTLFG